MSERDPVAVRMCSACHAAPAEADTDLCFICLWIEDVEAENDRWDEPESIND